MAIRNNINAFLTPEIFAKESALALRHELVMQKLVSTSLSKEFGAIGDVINVKDFSTFKVRRDSHIYGTGRNEDGSTYDSVNRINETSIPVRIEYQDGIDVEYSYKEAQLDMNLEDFHNNVIRPEAATVAEFMDRTILKTIQESDGNVATVSSYINNPDIYNDKLKTIPKINATRGVATKIGIPSTQCNFLFSCDANTILSNELVGLNTTQYPAKILERGYITTISGGIHIYESPSLLKDYKVFRAKETSVQLADNDATKYVINILKVKADGCSKVVSGDKTLLKIELEKEAEPQGTSEKKAFKEQERKLESYVNHKMYLEGLTFGHLFYEKKDTGVALQGELKKVGEKYHLEFDLTRVKRRVQNRINPETAPKSWGDRNSKYDVYFEGSLLPVDEASKLKGALDGKIVEIYPISNPLIVSRNVGYYIHKEAVKLVIAPQPPMDNQMKIIRTDDFAFSVETYRDRDHQKVKTRLDIMWGVKVIRPELIIKIIM